MTAGEDQRILTAKQCIKIYMWLLFILPFFCTIMFGFFY